MQNFDKAKELAAQRSLEFIEDGMVVGLGSGTTATHFIKLLGERVKQGLKVRGIASSQSKRRSGHLAIYSRDRFSREL